MNRLKQHLNDSLQELEMTPAMQAEIFRKAEKPARAARKHGRMAIAALLVMCMVGITAVAAVVSSGWQIQKEGRELVATPDQPTHAQLSKKAMKLIEKCIVTKERRLGYDTLEQFADAFGYKLLQVDGLQLEVNSVFNCNIFTNVGGLHAETAQITTDYHGRIYNTDGSRKATVCFDACLDMDEDPHDRFHKYYFESEDGDESLGQHPAFSTYYLSDLGVTAEIMSWPEDVFMGIEAFFIYENVTYNVSVDVPTNIHSTHESMLADCYAILDTLHE